ncbi:MAG: YcgL domain-containing protein [Pseudomonadota bacterium]|nr:MAG: YcgL domain-containing protein [Pseudomonadota bacterium]
MQCIVYRSAKKDETYLYVRVGPDGAAELACVPETLREMLGQLDQAMELELHVGRNLARADVNAVIAALQDQGYYLQLPPNPVLPDAG